MPNLEGFRLLDIIDILIIAVLLYQIYRILIGTRAWNVLRGIAAMGGLWFLAVQFKLDATSWLFNRVDPIAFLSIAIIFHPELRSALEQMGRGRSNKAIGSDPVNEIMTAMRELATKKVGALIAVENKTLLTEYGTNATPINAKVSAPLLHTLFDSKGPLHDGGVIIRGDTVLYAGAIFPLSDKNEGWSVKHGTRHRAALGLSEVTDSIVIIVSEERGTVSLAQNGVLKSDIAPADVLKALTEIKK